jgi:DNA uptake protein ComE-like DNA-binding protein
MPLAFAAAVLFSAPTLSVAQTAPKPTSSKVAKSARVDINTASKSDLTALSGIDDTTAQKIIDGRPYAKKSQLVTKKIVPQTTYNTIKDEIVAKKKQ